MSFKSPLGGLCSKVWLYIFISYVVYSRKIIILLETCKHLPERQGPEKNTEKKSLINENTNNTYETNNNKDMFWNGF